MFSAAVGAVGPQCVVYAAINIVNNKIYVGATEKGVAARSRRHFANASMGRPGKFNSAIRKYGKGNFEFLIVACCKDFNQALDSERSAIAAIMPEYNLTSGGGGVKGYKHTQEQIEKSASKRRGQPSKKKGICLSKEERKRVSDGVRAWWDKRGRSGRNINIILENAKVANAARRVAVICMDDGNQFSSVTEAAAFYCLTTGQVAYSCRRPSHKPKKIPKFRYKNS